MQPLAAPRSLPLVAVLRWLTLNFLFAAIFAAASAAVIVEALRRIR
jgi:hypothetical protein